MNTSKERIAEILASIQVMDDLEEYLETIPPRQIGMAIPMLLAILLAIFAYKYSYNQSHWSEMIDSALSPILSNKPELYKLISTFEDKFFVDKDIDI